MCECVLCGFVMHHSADFAVSYSGGVLRVCRFCREDLKLLGLRINHMARLELEVHEEALRFEADPVDWRSVLGECEELWEVAF